MLYTRKGDDGKTKTFGCNQRISKSSAIAEALGALDETNSYLGLVKTKSKFKIGSQFLKEIVHKTQENLFIIQAELAGAQGKTIDEEKVKNIEKTINSIEKKLPPIKSFFIPGATELGAMFDIARTISRRAERRVVVVANEKTVKLGEFSLTYLNRLSSLLYALARFSNYKLGGKEKAPNYK